MNTALPLMTVALLSTGFAQAAFAYSEEEVNLFDNAASAGVETKTPHADAATSAGDKQPDAASPPSDTKK